MDFGDDDRTEEFRKRLLAFMDECVYPAQSVLRPRCGTTSRQAAPGSARRRSVT